VVPLCTVRSRPQDLLCLRPCAGDKRPAPGAQSSLGSSDSDAKKAKGLPPYVFTAAMRVSDEQPLPWELVIYCVLLLLQVESQSGKKRRADASEQPAREELEKVSFLESVLSRVPGLGGLGLGWGLLGRVVERRWGQAPRVGLWRNQGSNRASRRGGPTASRPGAASRAGAGRKGCWGACRTPSRRQPGPTACLPRVQNRVEPMVWPT